MYPFEIMASWKDFYKPWSLIALIIFILSCSSLYFSKSLAHLKLNSHKNREYILCNFKKILGFFGNNFEMNLCDLTLVFRREFALDLILNRGWHNYLWWHDEHEHFDLHNEMKIRLLSVELDSLLPQRIYGLLRPVSRTLDEYSDLRRTSTSSPSSSSDVPTIFWNLTSSDVPQDCGVRGPFHSRRSRPAEPWFRPDGPVDPCLPLRHQNERRLSIYSFSFQVLIKPS